MNHCAQCSWTGTNDELRLKTYPNGGDDTVCLECGGRVEEINLNDDNMNYQKLFDYMDKEHGVILLEQDMSEIIHIVNEMQSGKEWTRTADRRPTIEDADEHEEVLCYDERAKISHTLKWYNVERNIKFCHYWISFPNPLTPPANGQS